LGDERGGLLRLRNNGGKSTSSGETSMATGGFGETVFYQRSASMRKYLLAAVAAAALSSPLAAQPYIGIEGGVLFPKDQDGDTLVDYTTTQTPISPLAPAGPADTTYNNAFGLDYKRGSDIDIILGYDFGMFRLEGELGRKRASLNEFEVDGAFISALNTSLNRPSAAPDPGAPGLGAFDSTDFDLGGKVKVRSYMLNGLLDFGDEDGLSFYAGLGIGRARVKLLGDSDNALAGQIIAGARYAITPNIDIGLKYRYFRTGKVTLNDTSDVLAGNPNRVTVAGTVPVVVDQTTNASLFTDYEQKFRSHSLLASLIFNFGTPAVALPPPPPPPAPVAPVPPATQTCADGSVILATDICPAPPPPPMPAPAPERG
jgi:opacity protein-like surface antigen